MNSLSIASLLLFGMLGLILIGMSLRAVFSRKPGHAQADGLPRDLDRLFSDISRGLRALSSPARVGGLFYREKQEEVGRLLADLQGRLRLLDEAVRPRYEAKAGQVLAEAARAGITLPPLESPLITSLAQR